MTITNKDAALSIKSLALVALIFANNASSIDITSAAIAANTGNDHHTIRADKIPCGQWMARPFRECHQAEQNAASIAGSVSLS